MSTTLAEIYRVSKHSFACFRDHVAIWYAARFKRTHVELQITQVLSFRAMYNF